MHSERKEVILLRMRDWRWRDGIPQNIIGFFENWIAEKCEGWNYWTCLVWIHTLRKKESHREKRWQRHHENTHGKVLWVPGDILSGEVVDSLFECWKYLSSKVSCDDTEDRCKDDRWCRWNVGKASMYSVSKPLYWTVVFQPSRDGVLNFFVKHGYTIGYMLERKKKHGKKRNHGMGHEHLD